MLEFEFALDHIVGVLALVQNHCCGVLVLLLRRFLLLPEVLSVKLNFFGALLGFSVETGGHYLGIFMRKLALVF